MWKVLGKSGHSNKSKNDLFEGFAETAVELASSEQVDAFVSQLPKRMIVISSHNGRGSYSYGSNIEDPKKIIAMISRVSAGSLYASDNSPDIDEKNVIESYNFIDLKDPYSGDISVKDDSEASALESLNTLYIKRPGV
jgi:hypothetical protein